MKRTRALVAGIFLSAAMLLMLSACGMRGADGKAFLALNWAGTPETVYFPMLPPFITAGTYYEHPEGTYYGEYTAWNWDFYSFWYTIEIDEGSYGVGVWPGEDGADRFYLMYLNSWGPELYYSEARDLAAKDLEAAADAVAERELALAAGTEPGREPEVASRRLELDPGRYDVDNPEQFRRVESGPGWSLTVEGLRYRLVEPTESPGGSLQP
ncbi:MAG: hypothetical protein JW820_04765 [Spirochaetales bacterium]|nr:hypothetical protein [Spirochaetales bacterium]